MKNSNYVSKHDFGYGNQTDNNGETEINKLILRNIVDLQDYVINLIEENIDGATISNQLIVSGIEQEKNIKISISTC